jgi:hypothetical protein
MSGTRTSNRNKDAKRSVRGSRRRTTRTSQACRAPYRGQKCIRCRQARLEYDGLAQLSCPVCGYVAEGGGFT